MNPRNRISPDSADLILHHGAIWTVDDALPRAQAVAIAGREIIAVGDDEEVAVLAGDQTRLVDLEGKLALPGFNDAHTHFVPTAAASQRRIDLFGLTSTESIREAVRRVGARYPELDWLIGRRWYPGDHAGDWPSRHDLDQAEASRPVAIIDVDGHTAWVNTVALTRLGYDASTPDPKGGMILREPDGFPTGILFENAHEPIPRDVDLDFGEFSTALAPQIRALNVLGITSLSNNSGPLTYLDFCQQMHADGDLNLRISHWPMLMEEFDQAVEARERFLAHPKLQVVGLKAFLDGVLSNRSAWLLEPYADSPSEHGYAVTDSDEMLDWAIRADAQGFQIITHALGDRAVREILDIYAGVAEANGKRDSRHRVEHMELIHPTDQVRFSELGVLASMTPVHLCNPDLDRYLRSRVGARRERYVGPWRDLVEKGARLSFGTDWPAISLPEPEPLKQIFAAATRILPMDPGRAPWHPEQRLSVERAIRCYTLEPAYAEFQERRKGSISVGKLADICVLDRNILDRDVEEILETRVVMTIFDGQVVYEHM